MSFKSCGFLRCCVWPSSRDVGESSIEDTSNSGRSVSRVLPSHMPTSSRRPKDDSFSFSASCVIVEPTFMAAEVFRFPKGTRVRFLDGTHYCGGKVAWTGFKKESVGSPDSALVIVLLDSHHESATDGEFEGYRLVDNPSDKEFLMLQAKELQVVRKIEVGDFCWLEKTKDGVTFVGGFARSPEEYQYSLFPLDADYHNPETIETITASDFMLVKAPPPTSGEACDEKIEAVGPIHLDTFLGRNKGIQGKDNSCYLDTLLFSFFAMSNVLNFLLFKEFHYYEYWDALSILRYQIVLPLRVHHFVSHFHVEELRSRIAVHSDTNEFKMATRDIQECMEILFGKILHVPSMVSVGMLNGDETKFIDSFSIETIAVGQLQVPTSQKLLEYSSLLMNFCLKEMPKFFLLQLPREKYQNSIVIPSLELDLNILLYKSVKPCSSCSGIATRQFRDQLVSDNLSSTFFCDACAESKSLNLNDGVLLASPENIEHIPETKVYLTAVICIQLSHYNCFVRCGRGNEERWVFYDSMNDQEELINPKTNSYEQFNIPLVEEVTEFRNWLTSASECMEKDGNLNALFTSINDGQSKKRCERIFAYPYALIYEQLENETVIDGRCQTEEKGPQNGISSIDQ